ncbi:MAG: penicillin-binding protein activator [Pseudomonadota bacterium]
MKKITLFLTTWLMTTLLTGCDTLNFFGSDAEPPRQSAEPTRVNTATSSLENPAFWQNNPDVIWAKLQQTPLNKLQENENSANPVEAGWLKLAVISKRDSTSVKDLTRDLATWRTQYPGHPGNKIFPADSTMSNLTSNQPPKNIALLLPLSGKYASLGKATRSGFLNAYYEALAKTGYQQNIAFYDTNRNQNMSALYKEAVSKGADLVIGPLTKDNVRQLTNSGSFSVPTLELNYTDSWGSLPSNVYQFGLSPFDEAKQVADKAYETGHTNAIVIAPQTEWGQTVAKALIERYRSDGGSIADTYYFSPQANLATDIPRLLHINVKEDHDKTRDQTDKTTLEQQRRQDFDVVFLLAPPQSARQIVPLLKYYYINKTPIYATSVVYSGAPQPQKDNDLNGVFFCEIPWSLNRSGSAMSDTDAGSNRLYAVGRDAYMISHNLSRFASMPNLPLYGATGEITMTPQKQFYRRLAWAQFHGGQP